MKVKVTYVSPYIGEWIEIKGSFCICNFTVVSPYIGEWIEIFQTFSYVMERICLTLHR